jgi:hypothetical protein
MEKRFYICVSSIERWELSHKNQKRRQLMSKFIKSFNTWSERVGRARAAAYLASHGYHVEAKRLMCDV